ncbi:hypothetical protein FBUS_06660 [Fasciolopsis buskii]|uniref:Uncharacterized protein n=1 Tax=Fasciolopsis buskii TaxID=27845 RepID=A0A8E0S0C3_9TREM|nr:hypothetical protein FBUS_06660 [Fasciolopsis buski]
MWKRGLIAIDPCRRTESVSTVTSMVHRNAVSLHQHVAVEMIVADFPVMVCCTPAIYRPVRYKRNRLVRGLCHSQSPYNVVSVLPRLSHSRLTLGQICFSFPAMYSNSVL